MITKNRWRAVTAAAAATAMIAVGTQLAGAATPAPCTGLNAQQCAALNHLAAVAANTPAAAPQTFAAAQQFLAQQQAAVAPDVSAVIAQGRPAVVAMMQTLGKTNPGVAAAFAAAYGTHSGGPTPPATVARVHRHVAHAAAAGCWPDGRAWHDTWWGPSWFVIAHIQINVSGWCGDGTNIYHYYGGYTPNTWVSAPYCWAANPTANTGSWVHYYSEIHLGIWATLGLYVGPFCVPDSAGAATIRIYGNGYWDTGY